MSRQRGVSIITATIRADQIDNVLRNYARQKWKTKELIILLNRHSLNKELYKKKAKAYKGVRVYQLPERYSLGKCLNFAVRRANYSTIAKFDDDDYYGPRYIPEAMRTFNNSRADIVGKSSIYFYFPHRKILLFRPSSYRPFRPCRRIAGATIMFRKKIAKKVKFASVPSGTDTLFLRACRKRGYRLYSTSSYHFATIRRENLHSHTWRISEKELFRTKKIRVIRTAFFQKYVRGLK